MLKRLVLACVALTLTGAAMPPNPAPTPPQAQPAKGRIRAVIIGVVNYKEGIATAMVGAWNDSVVIAETLIREGASADDVTLLLDPPEPALIAEKNPKLRKTDVKPDGIATRANILGALKQIADTTQRGDEVLLSFSGHGMQQNETVPGNEPDGLDEVFLPYDAGPAGTDKEKITNAVLDDEIGAAIDAIRAKGGNVTYLADFCHSGDSNRSATATDNGQPTTARLGLTVRQPKIFTVSDGNFVRDLAVETSKGKDGWGAYVGMLAVPSTESAKQKFAPRYADPQEQAPHGLLTVYAMANWNNPRVYSYRDLANRITAGIDEYKDAPRPEFDGDLDRPVMGGLMKTASASSGGSWAVNKPSMTGAVAKIESLEMTAGQLQGVVVDTIVRLALPTQQGDRTILYGRVSKADAYRAILVPTAYGDIPAEAWNDVRDIDARKSPLTRQVRLIATIEQRPLLLDYKIALPKAPAKPSPAQAATLAAFKAIKPADIGATFVQPGQPADLIMTFATGKNGEELLAFRQPTGKVTADFGQIDLGATMAAAGGSPDIRFRFTIGGALVKATRFSRLQQALASPAMDTGGEKGEDPAKQVKVEFFIARPKAIAAGAECPDTSAGAYAVAKDAKLVSGDGSEAGTFTFQRCDWLFIKMTNVGKEDVYVNPLIFSPDGSIYLWDGAEKRPGIKRDNPTRLRAGKDGQPGESGVIQYNLTDAQDKERLRDDFVLLVSDITDGVPTSYAKLVQCAVVPGPEDSGCASSPTLAGTQLRNNGGAGTGVEDLIDAALVGSETRGNPPKKPTSVSAVRFSWQTEQR